MLVNFTAHPTFMYGEDMLFSGDWPGHLQRTIESLVGEGVTAMYYNGAEGDQAPHGRPDAGSSRWERAERYGRDLGIVAWKQWQADQDRARRRVGLPPPRDLAARAHLASRLHEDRRRRIWPDRGAVQGDAARACFPRRSKRFAARWAIC